MNRVKFYVAGKIDLLPRRPLSVIIIYFFSNDIYIYIKLKMYRTFSIMQMNLASLMSIEI